MKNLSSDLIKHEKIVTTLAKAKYLRPYFEKLITRARTGSDFNNVKYMRKKLIGNETIKKILLDIGPRFVGRNGGYTRIARVGNRSGDNAPMARIEIVENKKEKTK